MPHLTRARPDALSAWARWLLWSLLAVLPLQGTAGVLAGLQGERHGHRASAAATPQRVTSTSPHDELLRLATTVQAGADRVADHGAHRHDGEPHRHAADEPGLLPLGDADGDANAGQLLVGVVFAPSPSAAGLPATMLTEQFARQDAVRWRTRLVAPPRRPPRLG